MQTTKKGADDLENISQTRSQNLYDHLWSTLALGDAFDSVFKNRGSAGIDGVDVKTFRDNLGDELAKLSKELKDWSYKPAPVRRVRIPKPDGGERLLGVPCVRDRVVQTALKDLLEPIFDPKFSDSSFGFRPNRNQRQAVERAQGHVKSGKSWIVDIDLSKFFDRINHDRLIHLLRKQITDTRILRLVGMFLRSGAMEHGLVSPSTEGSPQGGPLSPLLSNIVLDELDKELEKRGQKFVRYADDCNIFVGSEKAAERVMGSIGKFIENKLKLKINHDKSKVGPSQEIKFLGMTIASDGSRAISKASMKRAMAKSVSLVPRGTHLPIEQSMLKINQWYVGWSNYYKMTEYPAQLSSIEAHIRRRLRARFVRQQKRRRSLLKKLVKRGVSKSLAARTVYTNRSAWALSHTKGVERAYPNDWFKDQLGFKTMSDRVGIEKEWKELKVWIRLP